MNEIYDLDRFIEAQNAEDAYQTALLEIKNGRKSTHWMWYIFRVIFNFSVGGFLQNSNLINITFFHIFFRYLLF